MVRFLELAWDAIRNSALRLVEWVNEVAATGVFDPRGWPALVWALLAFMVLALLLVLSVRRRRRSAASTLPEMMISHGEIVLVDAPQDAQQVVYDMAAPAQASHRLSLTLSNLNPWPVQLLELAVRTRGLRQPVVAEAGSVVPPNGAVDVVADLFDLPGDVGVVELFLYSNRGGKRTYKLSAPLEWEPWDKRFRIRALSSRVTPVGSLASQERRRNERRSYESAKRRQRQRELAEATWRKAEEFTRQVKERRRTPTENRVAPLVGEQLGTPPGNGNEVRGQRPVGGEPGNGRGAPRYVERTYEERSHEWQPHQESAPQPARPDDDPVNERNGEHGETPEPRRLEFPDEF